MITFKSKMDVISTDDIFSEINSRYIAAAMLHGQLADYFCFLGLPGYAAMHEYQHIAEEMERRELCRYYIHKHGRLLPEHFSGEVNVVPEAWYTAKTLSIGKGTKQKAIEDGFETYRGWEEETRSVYRKYAEVLLKNGEIEDFMRVTAIVDDVSAELDRVNSIVLNLITSGYDMTYVVDSQKEIQKKYEKCMHRIEVE